MATIDPSIAMGYKPVQIENPLNQLAAYSQIQGAQQGQQLNALKMRQAQQDFDTQNALAEAYKGAFNQDTGALDYNLLTKQLAQRGAGSAIPALLKTQRETQQAEALLDKTNVEKQEAKRKLVTGMSRDLSRNPSDANIQAHFEDFASSKLFTPNEILTAQAKRDQLLAMPIPDRQAYLASQGATAGELKPTIKDTDIGGQIITRQFDPFKGTPTNIGQPIVKTPTFADIASQGQLNVSQQRLAADLDPTVQAKLAASKAAGTTAGKAQAAAAIALPNAIATSESLLSKLDAMVGTPAVKDKSGKVINAGTAPHPGFTGAVGMGRLQTLGIPGVEQLIPGTPAADFKARFDEIMGGAFLEAFETLKGGGAITETEGKKATAAKTRMSLAQSEKEFLAAANEYKAIVKTGIERARKKAGEAPSGGVDYDALVNKYTQ
jgi:hypothetical protein